jgi:hypothetical protein
VAAHTGRVLTVNRLRGVRGKFVESALVGASTKYGPDSWYFSSFTSRSPPHLSGKFTTDDLTGLLDRIADH